MTDYDHSVTYSYRWDAFGRTVRETEGSSQGSVVRTTQTFYNDAARQIDVKSDLNSNGDGLLVQTTWFDQLGRIRLTKDWAGNYVQKRYLVPNPPEAGHVSYELTSNPYVNQGESTMGWTRNKRDAQERLIELKHFSGAAVPTPWSQSDPTNTGYISTYFNSNCTTITDEAFVSHTDCRDGLGRVTQVTENGIGVPTNYGYDALDSLTSVTQPGMIGQRVFSYSSLRRLVSAYNQETGTIGYTYYAGGTLHTKADNRNTTTYFYNALDELTDKQYSDFGSGNPTPWVHYTYNKSWITQVQAVQAGSWSWYYTNSAFDSIGRVQEAVQAGPGGQSYAFHVTYKPLVGVDTLTYSNTGRLVRIGYDSGGRPYSITGQLGTNPITNYVTSTTYQTDGAILQQNIVNGTLPVSRTDNARLQPQTVQAGNLLTLTYTYSPTNNNGNVTGQTITRPGLGTWTQSYGYTELGGGSVNRLASAQETGSGNWSRIYGYDNRGNMWVSTNTGLPISPFTPTVSTNFDGWNHLTFNNALYDAAGNLGQIGGMQAQYDAENRVVSVAMNGTTTQYVYDGLGRRVTKSVGGQTTTYVYDPLGDLAQEYGPAATAGTEYLIADALGSTRLVVNGSGAALRCYDYVPFGEEIGVNTAGRTGPCFGSAVYPASADIVGQKFTGKERDAETGLDYFGARYFSGAQGRFTSPDEPFADQSPLDPQSWNLYSYVRNNPLRFIDPDGRCRQDGTDDNGNACFETTVKPRSWFSRFLNSLAADTKSTANVGVDLLNITPAGLMYSAIAGHPGIDRMQPANQQQAARMRANEISLQLMPVAEVSLPESAANALRLKAALSLEQAGILTERGMGLTADAIRNAVEVPISGGELTNPAVVQELTKNGSSIRDWGKFTTESIGLTGGQRSQIHFYMNKVTGEVNLNIDFKVKGTIR